MPVPAFTLDLGSILILVSTAMGGFVWRHLLGQIASGDKSLEERIERMERRHDAQDSAIKELSEGQKRIELTLNTLSTKFDLLAVQPNKRTKSI